MLESSLTGTLLVLDVGKEQVEEIRLDSISYIREPYEGSTESPYHTCALHEEGPKGRLLLVSSLPHPQLKDGGGERLGIKGWGDPSPYASTHPYSYISSCCFSGWLLS